MSAPSPIGYDVPLTVRPGPALLSGDLQDPSLAAHRKWVGDVPTPSLAALLTDLDTIGPRGRGGAGFPFATKLRAATAGRRAPIIVVNASEGEPASAKDSALALCAPHLMLDGARAIANATRAREVHVILPGERPTVAAALCRAMAERPDHFIVHTTTGGFVGGQARAVLELMAGRPNLPVTAWQPEAIKGHRGQPTLLSNAETFAQVGWLVLRGAGRYRSLGTPAEPGTTLITLATPERVEVCEVAYGDLLPLPAPPLVEPRTLAQPPLVEPRALASESKPPVLIGGFLGTWVRASDVMTSPVSVAGFAAAGTPLGAGVVVDPQGCPVCFTADVVDYLAGQSARRCGPCRFGLPALADAVRRVAEGCGDVAEVAGLIGLVEGRGACAHPDGTSRLVRSLLTNLAREVDVHDQESCGGQLGMTRSALLEFPTKILEVTR